MSLLEKAEALYFNPESIGSDDGASCGICWKFITDGGCVEVEGIIEAVKVCGLYVHGTPFEKDPHFPIQKVSKEEAGYGKGNTHCTNCGYMITPGLYRESPCGRVKGTIEGRGCCDVHEFK